MSFTPTTPESWFYLGIAFGLVIAVVVLATVLAVMKSKRQNKQSKDFYDSTSEALGYDEEGPLRPYK